MLNIYTVQDSDTQPLKSASFFAAVLRTYQPNIIVCDAGYGQDRNAYMYTQFPASLYSCYWTTTKDPGSKVRFKDQYNEGAHEITVDKTVAIQRVLHSVKGHLIGMFPWGEKLQMFTEHCKNTRIMDEESDGRVYSKATRVGPDHTVCSMAYALVGVQKLTNYNIKFNTGTSFEFVGQPEFLINPLQLDTQITQFPLFTSNVNGGNCYVHQNCYAPNQRRI